MPKVHSTGTSSTDGCIGKGGSSMMEMGVCSLLGTIKNYCWPNTSTSMASNPRSGELNSKSCTWIGLLCG